MTMKPAVPLGSTRVAKSRAPIKVLAKRPRIIAALKWTKTLSFDHTVGREGKRIVIEVKPDKGEYTRKVVALPADLQKPKLLAEQVVNETAWCLAGRSLETLIASMVTQARPTEIWITAKTGWRGKRGFVLPHRTIPAKARQEFLAERLQIPAVRAVGLRRGSLKAWRSENAAILGQSSIGIAATAAAFAAPLLPFAGISESMVLVLTGETTTGKTALQVGAMSVQGKATRELVQSPDVTERALSELACCFNHLMLPLDDIAKVAKQKHRALSHLLAYGVTGGGGRLISQRVQQQAGLPQLSYQTIALMTSELSAEEIAAAAGEKRLAGEHARLFDLRHPSAAVGGAFDMRDADEHREPHELAQQLVEASFRNHGHPLDRWIKWLRKQDRRTLEADIGKLVAAFVRLAVPVEAEQASPVIRRAAEKFGLLEASLLLARRAGIIPWKKSTIRKGVLCCFLNSTRRTSSPQLENQLGRLKRIIGDQARCPAFNKLPKGDGGDLPKDWIGIRGVPYKREEWLGLNPQGIEREFGEAGSKAIYAELRGLGFIARNEGQSRRQGRIPGYRRARLELVKTAFYDGDGPPQ